jgi:GTP-binding protein
MAAEFMITLATPDQISEAIRGRHLKGVALSRLAFVGRSNVGKSSLINALTESSVARVSQQPGKTRALHAYHWKNGDFILIDLPGYGYAKASHAERNAWGTFILHYLKNDPALAAAVVLLDSKVGPTDTDLQAIEFLMSQNVAIWFAMTKFDQLKTQSDRARRKKEVLASLIEIGIEEPHLFWVSAEKKTGLHEFRTALLGVKE